MTDTPPLSPAVLDLIPRLSDTSVADGFLLDPAGIHTRLTYRGWPPDKPGMVHHRAPADNWEWIPLTWAALTAQGSLTAVELGAGWGPWMSRCYALARTRGIANRRVIGVEAEPAHFGYLQQHMIDNDIPDADATLFHGLVAARSGVALFPLTDNPEQSWGLRQVGREGASVEEVLAQVRATPVPGEEGLYTVPNSPHKYMVQKSISLADLLGDTPLVDFMHVDIQGSEVPSLPEAIDLLNARVRLIAIGTHSHEIEATLRDCFNANGWICYHDTAMHNRKNGSLADGHQVWLNPRLGPQPPAPEETAPEEKVPEKTAPETT